MRVLLCDQHTKLARVHLPQSLRVQKVRPTQKTGGYSSAITISVSVRPTQKTGVWYLGCRWKNRPPREIRPHERLSCALHMNPVCATHATKLVLTLWTRSAFTQCLRDLSSRFRHTLSRIHCAHGVLYCVDRTSRLYPIIHAVPTYMVCNWHTLIHTLVCVTGIACGLREWS